MIHKIAVAAATLATIAHGSQPGAPAPVAAPMRELEWGQINFLHTTDTHGWLGGHLQEYVYVPQQTARAVLTASASRTSY